MNNTYYLLISIGLAYESEQWARLDLRSWESVRWKSKKTNNDQRNAEDFDGCWARGVYDDDDDD